MTDLSAPGTKAGRLQRALAVEVAVLPRVRSAAVKVFLSHSGTRSKAMADALYKWLPSVIQSVEPLPTLDQPGRHDPRHALPGH